eukprot:gene6064-biopygen3669
MKDFAQNGSPTGPNDVIGAGAELRSGERRSILAVAHLGGSECHGERHGHAPTSEDRREGRAHATKRAPKTQPAGGAERNKSSHLREQGEGGVARPPAVPGRGGAERREAAVGARELLGQRGEAELAAEGDVPREDHPEAGQPLLRALRLLREAGEGEEHDRRVAHVPQAHPHQEVLAERLGRRPR